ncbi:MAG: sulfotransferase domain-containing protein [Nitrosomonadales bacterium]|nr:sulfotransferase domain-containing protein [Nitrosomonadales bacterium]
MEVIMNKPPHFLIVGAPKAGTTSLYRYLQQHPQIFMPENKEPRFFCGYSTDAFEFGKKYFHSEIVSTKEDYLALFRDAPAGAISGEASTDYLSCPQAANRIHAWNPSAKIIIMLRNPVERAYSEYQHSIAAKFQTSNFWESLCLEEERIKQHYDPIFWHVRRGLYFEAIKEYIELFGKDRIRIIFFEEFANSTATVVASLFEFLGVSAFPVNVTERHNANAAREKAPETMRGVFASKFVRPIIQFIGKAFGHDAQPTTIYGSPYHKTAGVREMLTNEQYDWLCGNFREDILKLQALLGVDLGRWL